MFPLKMKKRYVTSISNTLNGVMCNGNHAEMTPLAARYPKTMTKPFVDEVQRMHQLRTG